MYLSWAGHTEAASSHKGLMAAVVDWASLEDRGCFWLTQLPSQLDKAVPNEQIFDHDLPSSHIHISAESASVSEEFWKNVELVTLKKEVPQSSWRPRLFEQERQRP